MVVYEVQITNITYKGTSGVAIWGGEGLGWDRRWEEMAGKGREGRVR